MTDGLAQDVARRWRRAMLAGDWEAAWRQTDRVERPRRAAQLSAGFVREPGHLVWDGSSFTGRSVLVRCEHGLGDTLQFSRFLPLLCAQARELHVMAQPHLLDLLRSLPGIGHVHDGWAGPHWPAHDIEVEVMELAYAFRATPSTVPPPLPLAARRTVDLDDDGRLRAGLLWSASEWDTSRSIALQTLRPLLATDGVRFFSLQQGPAATDPLLDALAVEPLSARTRDIAAAAGAMLQLDLVVCVDGMPAHLAASLGVPTWLLLKGEADWRWGSGDRTPWYPAMRLFRQQREGEWAGPVEQVAAELHARAAITCRSTA